MCIRDSQCAASRVAEKVEHIEVAVVRVLHARPDRVAHPVPVVELLGKKTHVAEIGQLNVKLEIAEEHFKFAVCLLYTSRCV